MPREYVKLFKFYKHCFCSSETYFGSGLTFFFKVTYRSPGQRDYSHTVSSY